LGSGEGHLEDVGKDEDDEPYVGGCVQNRRGGHDGVVFVASPDGEGPATRERVADDR